MKDRKEILGVTVTFNDGDEVSWRENEKREMSESIRRGLRAINIKYQLNER